MHMKLEHLLFHHGRYTPGYGMRCWACDQNFLRSIEMLSKEERVAAMKASWKRAEAMYVGQAG